MGAKHDGKLFKDDVQRLGPKCVSATLQAYRWAMRELLPTPQKVHYTFNLRDFSRVVQGVMLHVPCDGSAPAGQASQVRPVSVAGQDTGQAS